MSLSARRPAVAPHADIDEELGADLPAALLERSVISDGDALAIIAEALDGLLCGTARLPTQAAMKVAPHAIYSAVRL